MLNPIFVLIPIYAAAALIVAAIFWDFIYGAMYMKLPKDRVQKMIELAQVDKTKTVYDLGAGFGNIGFKAARLAKHVVMVEADPAKAWWIQRQIKKKQLTNVICLKADIRTINLTNADIILSYTSDFLMNKVGEKPLKSGCVIASCCHKIKGWIPTVTDKKGIYPIYLYTVTKNAN